MRLVETLGLVPGQTTTGMVREVARDADESHAARAAAIAALGEAPALGGVPAPDGHVVADLRALARADGPLSDVARLALHDLRAGRPAPRKTATTEARPNGLAVAQLFLHSDIDGELTHSGQGDTGGIATLLVHLGDALLAGSGNDGPIDRVLTISRGSAADACSALGDLTGPGHHYASVPFWGRKVHASEAWPLRVAARRGIRRIMLAAGTVDVVHLRMADVGSLAAAVCARQLGVPVVLTMAPDPQGLIAARDATGTLTRENFAEADRVEHLWFRDRLLRQMAAHAAHLVLFPRPDIAGDMGDLCGLDLTAEASRASVVSEGIDLAPLATTDREVRGPDRASTATRQALADLDALLGTLPPDRRDLPLAVSVGRLHRVKGMAALVEAWDLDPLLSSRCNLMLVGGDLEDPNDDEAAELARIDGIVPRDEGQRRGLLLAGHRPNATTAVWLSAVGRGRPGLAAAQGVYVSASLKEEFGIAILEAMATGLVVVAPASGGPATYVADGDTGVLVDTTSRAALSGAVLCALDLAAAPESAARAGRAQAMVRERFSIERMAAELTDIYARVAAQRHRDVAPTGGQREQREQR
jgi:glycosyltransferase involved in cell wall biosynthesis